MKNIFSKTSFSRLKRGLRIYALAGVAAATMSVSASEVLMSDADAGTCSGGGSTDGMNCSTHADCGPGGRCAGAPEMPLAMIPVFLLMSAGSVYYIRRRHVMAA